MANILRYSPADSAFDDLFRGVFMRPVRLPTRSDEGQQEVHIKLDVTEGNKEYTVYAEMPGVKKEDIHVTIDGSQIAISAELKNEKDIKEGEKVLRRERYYGKVSRAFMLDHDVDEAVAQAKYDNGVLELRLPKRISASSKILTIQ